MMRAWRHIKTQSPPGHASQKKFNQRDRSSQSRLIVFVFDGCLSQGWGGEGYLGKVATQETLAFALDEMYKQTPAHSMG